MFTNASIGLRPALREEEEEDFATSSGGASGMISATSSAGASHIIGAIDATPSFAPDLQRILGIAAAIGRRVDPGDYEVSFSSLLFALLAVPDGMAGMVIAGPSGADLIRRSQKLNGVPWNEIESIALEAPPITSLPESRTRSARTLLGTANGYAAPSPVAERHLLAAYIFDPAGHENELDGEYGIDRQDSAQALLREVEKRWPEELPQWHALYVAVSGHDPSSVIDDSASTASTPRLSEQVHPHADDPARIDLLSRRTFAEVLATRIEEISGIGSQADASATRPSFAVHLHGPWGTGKTSVFNFLQAHLQARRHGRPRWVVVKFDAWRQQRLRPPWWTLLSEIQSQAARQLDLWPATALRLRWLAWRARADWLPVLITVMLLAVAVWVMKTDSRASVATPADRGGAVQPSPGPANAAAAHTLLSDEQAKSAEQRLKVLIALAAASGALLTLSRSLVFGSGRSAQAYVDMRSDPLGPLVRVFGRTVRAMGRPVIVLIDDLDRCEGDFVVDLLEGLQTLLREAPVTYVVAADRKWIASSFEKRYEQFGLPLGEPGRPLGYLFLDKIFQVSTEVPRLSHDLQTGFFNRLLMQADGADDASRDEHRRQAEHTATESVAGSVTHEALQARIREAGGDQELEIATRAAAARKIASAEAQLATEHRLQWMADLLEPNPRAMKRLLNAYAMNQAAQILAGRDVLPESLARWTILEQRWPLLAEFLALSPRLTRLFDGSTAPTTRIPPALADLVGNDAVAAVIGRHGADESGALDEAAVRLVTGQRPAALASAAADDPDRGG